MKSFLIPLVAFTLAIGGCSGFSGAQQTSKDPNEKD